MTNHQLITDELWALRKSTERLQALYKYIDGHDLASIRLSIAQLEGLVVEREAHHDLETERLLGNE